MENFLEFITSVLTEHAYERMRELKRNDRTYQEKLQKVLALSNQLKDQLTKEQHQSFIELSDLEGELSSTYDQQLYLYGIQDCIQLLKFLQIL
ncbi:MAG: hypothetical protein IJ333_00335 [Clostridia bacterium]|nr:hypothetical protein [Clostridia bacterium]